MRPTDGDDGLETTSPETGETTVPFESFSDSSMTKQERYKSMAREWVLVPAKILFSDWRATVGLSIILFYVLMGTVGVYAFREPSPAQAERLLGPFENMAYPLGTTTAGEDVLAQIVHATPPMLKMIIAGALFTTIMATAIGILSGYKGGLTDRVLMTFTDILMTIPGLPLIIVIAVILEPRSPWIVGLVITINAWAGLARSIRSQVLTIRDESFVEASRLMGISTKTILGKDVLPGLMPYIFVNFVNSARTVIFTSVGLYFLGILPFSNDNWGVHMYLAYTSAGAISTPSTVHLLLAPMGAIILLSFGLILFAQGTDRIFNPRVRARHESTGGDDRSADEEPSTVTKRING